MIVEINGKKLVFGMDWPTLVEPGAYSAVAARKAFGLKAPLLWHQSNADYAGFVRAKEGNLHGTGALYAAAQAFARVPELPPNALLVVGLPDGNFATIGLHGGRPLTRFDQTGLTTEAVKEVVKEFGTKCGDTGFALVGDSRLVYNETRPEELPLSEIAACADDACLLKPPSRAALYKTIALGAVTVAVLSGTVLYAKQTLFPPEPNHAKTATEVYQDSLLAHANDPMVRAIDYRDWYDWMRNSLQRSYGGWALTKVNCEFGTSGALPSEYVVWSGTPTCTLSFRRQDKEFATNATFIAAVPKGYAQRAVYLSQEDMWMVHVEPPRIRTTALGKLLQGTSATKEARDVAFVSLIQAAARFVTVSAPTDPTPFLVPPGYSTADIKGPLYKATHWQFKGASHFTKLLDTFPPYATLSKAELTVTMESEADSDKSPFQVNLEGELFTRN